MEPIMSKAAIVDFSLLLKKLAQTLQAWLEGGVVMLPNVVLAVLIMVVGVIVSRWVMQVLERVLFRLTGNDPISRLLAAAGRIVLMALTALWALGLLHLDKTVTSVLAGVGVLGLALGFAFQDIAAN